MLPAFAPAAPNASAHAQFVRTDGTRLFIGDEPWQAIGFNFWDMDAARVISGDVAGCYYQHVNLDEYFDASFERIVAHTKANAVRTFGFIAPYTGGGIDWSSTDKLLHYARKHNVRVIPVLGDQFANCGETLKKPSWYHCAPADPPGCIPGYKRPGPWGPSYRDYAKAVVSRYKNEPAIAFWQLMNEAFVDGGGSSDPSALADFASDMIVALRTEAGDTNHLISMGTVGVVSGNSPTSNQLEPFKRLLDCTGPCIDIASAHYYGAEAVQGMPAAAAVSFEVFAGPASHPRMLKLDIEGRTPQVDGWRTVKATVYNPQTQQFTDDRTWGIRFKAATTRAWSIQIDGVTVQTAAGHRVYDFETGTEGFTGSNAALSRRTDDADTGLGSLRAATLDPSQDAIVTAPGVEAPILSLSLRLRVNFSAPLAQEPGGLAFASYLREATVTRGKPFIATEIGVWSELTPYSPDGRTFATNSMCAGRGIEAAKGTRVPISPPHRALLLEAMFALQLNEDHASSGILVWDWKDPALLVARPDGTRAVDTVVNCFSVHPGDPATQVIAKWAARTTSPPLDPPAALGPDARLFVGLPGPETAKVATTFVLKGRVTQGGNPVPAARVEATGGCFSFGPTDSLGHASIVCRIDSPGTHTITLAGNGACACPGSRTYTIVVEP